ncbi:MAG: class I SAM-dependent methyltransferase [Gammaproteobacteria bacterium]|nr:class I SAM-dependent methyltransferase [Gammaproteobacteria bacterium]MCP5135978.1 class I SAM-dependent methyltransferase [Gammaproteobacteria bacterium]
MTRVLVPTVIDDIRCYSPNVAEAYDDYPEEGFAKTEEAVRSSFWVRSRNRLFKQLISRHNNFGQIPRFLEIGCGTGNFVGELVEDVALKATASEVYIGGLRYARNNHPNIDFVQYDVTQGIIGDGFDIIASFDVFEHIDDDVTAIRNVYEMLNDDGFFVISVPQHQILWSRLDEIVKHKRRYSRKDLVGKLSAAGFEVTYVGSFVFMLFPLMLLARLMDRSKEAPIEAADDALQERVEFHPLINFVFDKIMRVDELMISIGLSLPFGGTLFAIARKSSAGYKARQTG